MRNDQKSMLKKEDAVADTYTSFLESKNEKQPKNVSNYAQNQSNQKVKIDEGIMEAAMQIRNQQNWISSAEDICLDDYGGDQAAMLQAKLQAGVRMLSQDEKNLMLGLYNQKLREGFSELKKIAGVNSPP